MTDISDLHEGDEIEVVWRMTIKRNGKICGGDCADYWFPLNTLDAENGVQSITVIRPEISVGQPYVADDGRLYVGRAGERVVHIDDNNAVKWYGTGYGPMPAGLRPANVVPEPATHDGPRRTVDAPAVHGGGRVVAE